MGACQVKVKWRGLRLLSSERSASNEEKVKHNTEPTLEGRRRCRNLRSQCKQMEGTRRMDTLAENQESSLSAMGKERDSCPPRLRRRQE